MGQGAMAATDAAETFWQRFLATYRFRRRFGRESWWASFRGAIRAAWGDGSDQGRLAVTPNQWLMCSSPPSWVVELPSLYFCARSIACSRAAAVSNWTRSILSLALRILFGPPKRCARFIVFIGSSPMSVRPRRGAMTHTDQGHLVARRRRR